jgi:hypothetical protein
VHCELWSNKLQAFQFQAYKSTHLYYNSAQSLLNGPPLSNFVDRGLGEWEWLGPGSTKINKDYLYYNSAHGPPKWPLSVVTQHSDVFITETRFTQHGPVLISGCGFTQHGRVLISRSFLIWHGRFALCTSGSVSHNTAGFDIGIPFHWQGRGHGRAARQGRAGGRAGSVCPSVCLSCRAGRAGQAPNKTYKTSEWPKVTGTHGGLHSGLRPRAPTSEHRINEEGTMSLGVLGIDQNQIINEIYPFSRMVDNFFWNWP